MSTAAAMLPRIADVELESVDGRIVRLGSLWNDRPVVLAFIRHFG